jgi:uncharacterized protein
MTAAASAGPMTASTVPVAAAIGLRFPHHQRFLEERPHVAWLEVHTENYLGGGTARRCLNDLRGDYPLSLHGVGLSLGSAEGIDRRHLERIATLVRELEPQLVSEHLSWSTVGGRYLADLLPLPLTEEALEILCRNVTLVQEQLKRRVLIENPSTYLEFEHSTIPEWEFLAALVQRTGCGVLCDVNNIFVSASNHGWNPEYYLRGVPAAAIEEIHLAGHATRVLEDGRVLRIDNHGSRVSPEVWRLYLEALRLYGPRPTLIEWDTDIPPLEVLLEEAAHAQRLIDETASGTCTLPGGGHLSPTSRPSALQTPTVAAVQQAVRSRLFGTGHEAPAAGQSVAGESAAPAAVPGLSVAMHSRLSIYGNTCRSVLLHALQLSFPAVQRLVGEEFFEGAADHFIDAGSGIPRSAWLNDYGAAFPAFLAAFAPAAQLAYLADVARLEWAVNEALHAPDAPRLDPARLADVLEAPADEMPRRSDVRLVPHPSVTLLSLGFPADAIWQAVLDHDDAALASLDPAEGPVWLLIERDAAGVQVKRLSESAWRFTARLCAGDPLHATLAEHAPNTELGEHAAILLAEHFSAGRFTDAVPGVHPS